MVGNMAQYQASLWQISSIINYLINQVTSAQSMPTTDHFSWPIHPYSLLRVEYIYGLLGVLPLSKSDHGNLNQDALLLAVTQVQSCYTTDQMSRPIYRIRDGVCIRIPCQNNEKQVRIGKLGYGVVSYVLITQHCPD
jgi:hypothetical protein